MIHQTSMPTLHILPKVLKKQVRLRRLIPQRGIMWSTIATLFIRQGWEIHDSTDLFIKVYHPETSQTILLSKMSAGHVLVNQDYQTFSVSELHEIEDIAEGRTEQKRFAYQSPKVSQMMLSLIIMIMAVLT